MSPKHELRRILIEKRLDISPYRRQEAREKAEKVLSARLKPFARVLSFASKEEEIDLWPLNAHLAQEGKLLLTKVMPDDILTPFHVKDLERDLSETGRWKLKEPLPKQCPALPLDQIDCVLVPGLGFDNRRHRLGYGMGHFDRFLAHLSCPFFGVGFQEQFVEEPLPTEPHDIALTEIFLF